jgi:hypothetical protein
MFPIMGQGDVDPLRHLQSEQRKGEAEQGRPYQWAQQDRPQVGLSADEPNAHREVQDIGQNEQQHGRNKPGFTKCEHRERNANRPDVPEHHAGQECLPVGARHARQRPRQKAAGEDQGS